VHEAKYFRIQRSERREKEARRVLKEHSKSVHEIRRKRTECAHFKNYFQTAGREAFSGSACRGQTDNHVGEA
jgi:hypothetical protein